MTGTGELKQVGILETAMRTAHSVSVCCSLFMLSTLNLMPKNSEVMKFLPNLVWDLPDHIKKKINIILRQFLSMKVSL
jgi:hypothetical protein